MASLKNLLILPALAIVLGACSGAQETSSGPETPTHTPPTPIIANSPPESAPKSAAPNAAQRPEIQTYEIVATFPHDEKAFTQGLFFWNGILYESTGRYGESTIRKTQIETGEVTAFRDLPPEYFGEGITRWKDQIIALTWRASTGFILDLETLSPITAFTYPGEGWGITANETQLIQSDGSAILRFLDPETFDIESTLQVNLNGKPLRNINELEWINGEIWANVWQSDLIARIDPESGNVKAVIDFSDIFPTSARQEPNDDVLNGIAHDRATDRLFITGKHWPNLYEIRVKSFASPPN